MKHLIENESSSAKAIVPHEDVGVVDGIKIETDAAIEQRILRKQDRHLLGLMFAIYLLSFLDRSNIGNAKIAGMQDDLHLVGNRYQWLLTIFYIPYILFEWQNILFKVIPPRYMATWVIFSWGVVATCQAAAQSWAGEMVLRFLLGATEAGVPGLTFMLSFFYLRSELGFRCGLFLAAAPLATCFAGALAYGITSGHPAISSWRLLFLVEGLPAVAMAPVVFFFLPDSPTTARFLNDEEKRVALARVIRQNGDHERLGHVAWKDVAAALTDVKAWLMALMYFSCNVSFASLPVYLPTILEELGFSGVNAQGLSAPPYFLAFLTTLLSTWIADRTQQRGLTIICCSLVGAVGYVILATTRATGSRYAGAFLAAAGVFPCIANLLPWQMNNQGNDTRRGIAIVMLNLVGQCGPLLGTNVYPPSSAPRYIEGQSVCASFMFFVAILAVVLRTLLAFENRKLDRKYGTVAEQNANACTAVESQQQQQGMENYGPLYRYVL